MGYLLNTLKASFLLLTALSHSLFHQGTVFISQPLLCLGIATVAAADMRDARGSFHSSIESSLTSDKKNHHINFLFLLYLNLPTKPLSSVFNVYPNISNVGK